MSECSIYLFLTILSGKYECHCPQFWNGINCEMFDEHFPGGIGYPATPPPTTTMSINQEREECDRLGCKEKAYNGKCDVSI